MAHARKLRQDLLLRQQLVMTPPLQQAIKILGLSLPDLALVENELDVNLTIEQLDKEIVADEKPIVWMSSGKEDLKAFSHRSLQPDCLRSCGRAGGGQHSDARPRKGFAGEGLLEVAEDFHGDTYRAIYAVRLEEAIYVLHAFREDSTSRVSTSQREATVIKQRLKRAEELHLQRIVRGGNQGR